MKTANYVIESQDDMHVILRDVGPWDKFKTITNAAEEVVKEMMPALGTRRLFYIDSDDDLTELVIEDGRFSRFIVMTR